MARPRDSHGPAAAEDASGECFVHLKRADGLDLELSGTGNFVAQALERLLVALGIVAPPAS